MTSILDLDSILDSTLDGVEDLPDYVTPPAGNYRLAIDKVEVKEYESKKEPGVAKLRINLTHKVVATKELPAGSMPVADGSLFVIGNQADEDGLKYFKRYARQVLNVEALDGISIRQVMDELTGVEFDGVITIRKTKDKDTGQEYENVNVRVVHQQA